MCKKTMKLIEKKIQHALKTNNNTQLKYIPHRDKLTIAKLQRNKMSYSLFKRYTVSPSCTLPVREAGLLEQNSTIKTKFTYLGYPHHIQQYSKNKKNISYLIQRNKLN